MNLKTKKTVEIGCILKNIRINKELELNSVSKDIKIPIDVIKIIESGEFLLDNEDCLIIISNICNLYKISYERLVNE
jgi:flagellin-specific chaperone FliS